MIEHYTQIKCEQFFNFKSKLIFSKNFRRLNGKTQLFSSKKGDYFRNRMIHTEEVRQIALKISKKINENLKYNLINYDLVECISISHDFGHTPFGHIGERTLQAIVSKKDDLGGLLSQNKNSKQLFFKHNINSLRLLVEEFKNTIPWEILDGVLKHSRLNYEQHQDNGISSLISGTEYDKIFYKFKDSEKALTFEGQIVAIADEIAQRYSDFEDTFRAKNINVLKKQIKLMKLDLSKYNEHGCVKYIDKISNLLIESVVEQSIKNINQLNLSVKNSDEIINILSKNDVIEFDKDGKELNDTLDLFIKDCLFNVDELRKEDERNKYIIRQLFKAYYNNCLQITGEYLLTFIKKLNTLRNALEFNEHTKKNYNNVVTIQFIDNEKINSSNFKEFIYELKKVEFDENNQDENLSKLYCEYIRSITFYISAMTDNYALDCFKFMYEV